MRPVLPLLAGKICVLALNRIIMKLYFLVNLLAARAFAYTYISLPARNCCDVFLLLVFEFKLSCLRVLTYDNRLCKHPLLRPGIIG